MAARILIIDLTLKDSLRESEFVTPLRKAFPKANVIHYTKVNAKGIRDSSGIILSGTTLLDHDYAKNLERFSWLKKYDRPVLGICAGQQVLVAVLGGKIVSQKVPLIGLVPIQIDSTDVLLDGLSNPFNGYMLHQSTVSLPEGFIVLAHSADEKNVIIRHAQKPFYGVSFHPEVRNELLLQNFGKIVLAQNKKIK